VDDIDEVRLRSHHVVYGLVCTRRFIDDVRIFAAFDTGRHARVIFERKRFFRRRTRHLATRAVTTRAKRLRISLPAHDETFRAHASWNDVLRYVIVRSSAWIAAALALALNVIVSGVETVPPENVPIVMPP
jgi:hypothetical protein